MKLQNTVDIGIVRQGVYAIYCRQLSIGSRHVKCQDNIVVYCTIVLNHAAKEELESRITTRLQAFESLSRMHSPTNNQCIHSAAWQQRFIHADNWTCPWASSVCACSPYVKVITAQLAIEQCHKRKGRSGCCQPWERGWFVVSSQGRAKNIRFRKWALLSGYLCVPFERLSTL